MNSNFPTNLPPGEEPLYGIWAQRRYDALKLRTVDGALLQVVFPGRRNGMEGPDFLDASVHVEGQGLLRGDVEVHVRARDWMSHGHHRDPAYNNVILHVVWVADSLWTERQDGQHVPTTSIRNCLLSPDHWLPLGEADGILSSGGCAATASSIGTSGLEGLLDEAGNSRFSSKVVRFRGELAVSPSAEVLYKGILHALGYSRNREPFISLAQLLPWSTIELLASTVPEDGRADAIAAWLLGTAGLMDSATPAIEEQWRRSRLTREMAPRDWRLAGVRLANHPACRILGAGHLLARFTGEGLLDGFERAILLAAHHDDPALLIELAAAPPSIGRERAREIIVNIVLPFFNALALDEGRSSTSDAASRLFTLLPPGPGNRKVEDMANQLGIGKGLPVRMTARREQGLVHLVEGACRHGSCADCPLGRAVRGQPSLAAVS